MHGMRAGKDMSILEGHWASLHILRETAADFIILLWR
jgi:hypothetical protein